MNRFGMRLGQVLSMMACVALVAIPLQAAEEERTASKESSAEQGKATKESDLVRASNAYKKKAEAKTTYTNDDLAKDETAEVTYTNEDLSRMFGGASAESNDGGSSRAPSGSGPGPSSGEQLPDPLTAMENQKQAQATREQRVEEAESNLAMAEAKLKSLETQLLATKNPFSARPELSAEEQETRATTGETAQERNARTNRLVDEARAEVTKAQAALTEARSR